MNIFFRFALAGVLFLTGAASVWASSTAIYNGAVLSLNGMNFTVSGCSLSMPGVSSCSANDGIYLQGINTGRGTVTYEVIGTGGGPVFSLAQNSTSITDSLTFTLTAVTNLPNSKVSAGNLTLNGVTSSGSYPHVSAVQTFKANSPYAAPTGLTGFNLNLSSSQTTASGAKTNFTNSPALSSFQVTTTLSLQNSSLLGVKLNSMMQTFNTVPEPASLAILALSLGGLTIARRRRDVRSR